MNKISKLATLSTLAIVAVASLGGSYYFLGNSQISASLSDPGLPSVPGIPNATSQTGLPPLPPAPVSDPSSQTDQVTDADSLQSSEDESLSSLETFSSETLAGNPDGFYQPPQPGETVSSSTPASGEETISPSAELTPQITETKTLSVPLSQPKVPEASSPNSKLFGIIAAIIAAISLLAFIFLALKWRKPQG